MPPARLPLDKAIEGLKKDLEDAFSREFAKVQKVLEKIEPKSVLPPIASPVRGKDYVRDPNVASPLRAFIQHANGQLPIDSCKYNQFPEHIADRKLNTDAKDALEIFLIETFGPDYGKHTWGTICRTTHFAKCENIVRTAVRMPDFVVFRQTSNFCPIRWWLEQKMKSKGRYKINTSAVALSVDNTRSRTESDVAGSCARHGALTRGDELENILQTTPVVIGRSSEVTNSVQVDRTLPLAVGTNTHGEAHVRTTQSILSGSGMVRGRTSRGRIQRRARRTTAARGRGRRVVRAHGEGQVPETGTSV